jgi:hypothetical protein
MCDRACETVNPTSDLFIGANPEVQTSGGPVSAGRCENEVFGGQSHEVLSLVETYRENYFRL